MVDKKEEFQRRLLATFRAEAAEHLRAIASGFLEMEKNISTETRHDLVESVYREVHSFKGAARSVNLNEVESVCHALESVLAAVRQENMPLTRVQFDILNQTVNVLGVLLESSPENQPSLSNILRWLKEFHNSDLSPPSLAESVMSGEENVQQSSESEHPVIEPLAIHSDTVRISTERLHSLSLQMEELLNAGMKSENHGQKLREIDSEMSAWNSKWESFLADLSAFRHYMEPTRSLSPQEKLLTSRIQSFLQDQVQSVRILSDRMQSLSEFYHRDSRSLTRLITAIREGMKHALSFPCRRLLEIIPKLARDLARDQGKDIKVELLGGEIEVDRRILEEMKTPLIHLVRNCLDHGIETPPIRRSKNKPTTGTIRIIVTRQDYDHIELQVSDDGSGLPIDRIRQAVVRQGIYTEEEARGLRPEEVQLLIFRSGVSSSPQVTDLSGRGLGLAIVYEKVKALGGEIAIQSRADEGTDFRISLPNECSSLRGILVRLQDRFFVIPVAYVERAIGFNSNDIATVENRPAIHVNGEFMTLVRLQDLLEFPPPDEAVEDMKRIHCLVVCLGPKRLALQVDEILGEQEVAVKPLGAPLSRVRNIAGMTVLGSGMTVPLLHVADLVQSAQSETVHLRESPEIQESIHEEKPSILVVEDSITSRVLIKSILEMAGYQVKTAVDGIDAYTQLCVTEFDLVVSDVDMPRLNGFELTTKIRKNNRLSSIPVVLVTALDSREDRERGIDSGANAYIVKSNFEQSDLIQTIQRFIG